MKTEIGLIRIESSPPQQTLRGVHDFHRHCPPQAAPIRIRPLVSLYQKTQYKTTTKKVLLGHREQINIGCFVPPCEYTVKIYGKLQCFQLNIMEFNTFF